MNIKYEHIFSLSFWDSLSWFCSSSNRIFIHYSSISSTFLTHYTCFKFMQLIYLKNKTKENRKIPHFRQEQQWQKIYNTETQNLTLFLIPIKTKRKEENRGGKNVREWKRNEGGEDRSRKSCRDYPVKWIEIQTLHANQPQLHFP